MPWARRTDRGHADFVRELRARGFSVADTSGAGSGFPDIVVGAFGRNFMFEIKTPKCGRLTPAQKKFHARWSGQLAVVETVDQVVELVNRAWARAST